MGDVRLEAIARACRVQIIRMLTHAGSGHPGGSLSVIDLLVAIAFGPLRHDPRRPDWPDRDRIVLSKGHAVPALYTVMARSGYFPEEQLITLRKLGSPLQGHPDRVALPGIEAATGSLGQGLSIGAGVVLAARLQGSARRAFVLMSDAECNEGSVWEAAMFAAHHRLSALTALIDLNGQQAMGRTDDILSLSPMAERWRAFGWDVHEVDGHDHAALGRVFAGLDTATGPPHVLVARTVFGKGVSYMERQLKWHYLPMSDDDYGRALQELGGVEACAERSSVR